MIFFLMFMSRYKTESSTVAILTTKLKRGLERTCLSLFDATASSVAAFATNTRDTPNKLGIPMEAMDIAIAINAIVDFPATASNVSGWQMLVLVFSITVP